MAAVEIYIYFTVLKVRMGDTRPFKIEFRCLTHRVLEKVPVFPGCQTILIIGRLAGLTPGAVCQPLVIAFAVRASLPLAIALYYGSPMTQANSFQVGKDFSPRRSLAGSAVNQRTIAARSLIVLAPAHPGEMSECRSIPLIWRPSEQFT